MSYEGKKLKSTLNLRTNLKDGYVCIYFENKQRAYIHLQYLDLEYVSIDYKYLPKIYLDDNPMYFDYYFNIYCSPYREDRWIE